MSNTTNIQVYPHLKHLGLLTGILDGMIVDIVEIDRVGKEGQLIDGLKLQLIRQKLQIYIWYPHLKHLGLLIVDGMIVDVELDRVSKERYR
jgi:hypothetical protein